MATADTAGTFRLAGLDDALDETASDATGGALGTTTVAAGTTDTAASLDSNYAENQVVCLTTDEKCKK